MRTVLALLGALGSLSFGASPAQAALDSHTIASPTAFPEGLAAGSDGRFFTGSVVDGTIFAGTLDTRELRAVSPAGADGRSAAAGMELDRQGRLWVAGAGTGKLFVYDASNLALRHIFVLAEPKSGTVNDLAIVDGTVYITDSSTPRLWRVPLKEANPPGTTAVTPWLRVGAPIVYRDGQGTAGVNLNGLAATPSGRALIVVQTNTGQLWRIDRRTRRITAVRTTGGPLTFGDGLIAAHRTAYVARNATGEVDQLELRADGRKATVVQRIRRAAFAFPTAVALSGNRLLVANAQLDKTDPALPFTISDLNVSATAVAR